MHQMRVRLDILLQVAELSDRAIVDIASSIRDLVDQCVDDVGSVLRLRSDLAVDDVPVPTAETRPYTVIGYDEDGGHYAMHDDMWVERVVAAGPKEALWEAGKHRASNEAAQVLGIFEGHLVDQLDVVDCLPKKT